jgi:hypothetical protein
VHAGDDLHQRGLAGAVFAANRMNFSLKEFEVHIAERHHAGECFDDALQAHATWLMHIPPAREERPVRTPSPFMI